ncbi:hypothetical protein GCM10017779_63020 [Streptomyces capillispiralis]|uniref:Uncharacterized protein n=1 Tax=Streptomyces capillispiralis TaxID=68182 RepID=A0A561TC41_9ACTN|nr:hypothetical protein FHX78_111623 [Streptomyces capillispiralis]GHH95845.1 hypothetical protein GCM10017779_63020 [Streptomyces capillispiralis]
MVRTYGLHLARRRDQPHPGPGPVRHDVGERLRHALGFQATYEQGAAVPSRLCGRSLHLGLGPVTEVGHNALHNRLGHAMPNTQALTERTRPCGTNNLFVAWETLTHGDNPA